MKYLITTQYESYVMEAEKITQLYRYCLKKYPYQDFTIETNN